MVFGVLALVGPLLMLATAVVALASYGPLGWLAALLLVVAVVAVLRWTWRLAAAWWRSTRVPDAPARGPRRAGS